MAAMRIYRDTWHGTIHAPHLHAGNAARILPAADEKEPESALFFRAALQPEASAFSKVGSGSRYRSR